MCPDFAYYLSHILAIFVYTANSAKLKYPQIYVFYSDLGLCCLVSDSCWMEEALTKIRNVENTHQYLKYHASMILALQGKETESRIKYRESLNG